MSVNLWDLLNILQNRLVVEIACKLRPALDMAARARMRSLLLLVNDAQIASKFYTHGLGIPLVHKVGMIA